MSNEIYYIIINMYIVQNLLKTKKNYTVIALLLIYEFILKCKLHYFMHTS